MGHKKKRKERDARCNYCGKLVRVSRKRYMVTHYADYPHQCVGSGQPPPKSGQYSYVTMREREDEYE